MRKLVSKKKDINYTLTLHRISLFLFTPISIYFLYLCTNKVLTQKHLHLVIFPNFEVDQA